jgi:serine protease AprX
MQFRSTLFCSTILSLVPAVVAQSADGAATNGSTTYQVGNTSVRRILEDGVAHALMSRDGSSWQRLQAPDDRLHFRLGQFDPTTAMPQFTGVFAAPADTRLHIVQFQTQVLPDYRTAVERAGAEILHFLPANALYVRGDKDAIARVQALACVRWVGPLANAFKLDDDLRNFVVGDAEAAEFNLVLAKKSDRALLSAQVASLGGEVTHPSEQSTMLRARLTPAQLAAAMAFDTFVWADRASEIEYDMDNARIQGGANYVETLGNYRGQGVRAEITEFFQETHPDLVGRWVLRGTNNVSSHGHCTAGIVGGNGSGDATATGVMPECTLIEGGYTSANNHAVQILGSVQAPVNAMQGTASWGSARTFFYTSVSQAMDDALFQADWTRTQSQSNAGNQDSRPEAWAKNSISVGGVRHGNNANPADDNWTNGASIGPASDGRIKPDICAYYDLTWTTDRTGTAGYASGNYYNFSGTSGATPIVNGYLGLMQQMFTDGLFGNPLPQPANDANRFANRAHMTTNKALLCNTASQYTFSGTGHDLTRVHQGWGFPSAQRLYDNRSRIVVCDEYDTLQVGQTRTYFVHVAPGTPEFRATMVYNEPAALPSAAIHLINNLDLKVTRLSDGTFWWGNNGLVANMFSTPGGSPNGLDNIECVYLNNPAPGTYVVEVTAASIVQDAKLETPQVDADFALVMHPMGGGYQTNGGLTLDLTSSGPGNLVFDTSNVPATGWSEGFTALSFTTDRGRGFGRFFGIEDDGLTASLWSTPAAAGNVFHFTNSPGAYPFVDFTFPDPALVSFLAGVQLDSVMVLFGTSGVVAVSNVSRITLQ